MRVWPQCDYSILGRGRIWPDDFSKKIFPGGPYYISVNDVGSCSRRRRNVWRLVYIRESFGHRLCIGWREAELQWWSNIHGASHVPVPRLTSTISCLGTSVRSPREVFFLKIIRPNSSFGALEGSRSSGIRNVQQPKKMEIQVRELESPTCIMIAQVSSIGRLLIIDRSIGHGRYRRSIRIHLLENTVDIDGR